MNEIRGIIEKTNKIADFEGSMIYDEPMSHHTSFKTGGPADLWVRPAKSVFPQWTAAMLQTAKAGGVPVFFLGGGANLLVSDRGIRGIVLDTGAWTGYTENADEKKVTVAFLSGTSVESMTNSLAERGLRGLEFLAGMPGTAGGAVWMNARCYGKSVSDVLYETEILDIDNLCENPGCGTTIVPFRAEDFSYKKSPFQNRNVLIMSAAFNVERISPAKNDGNCVNHKNTLKSEMEKYIKDREVKGHYRFPSAGSVFKNNPAFGAPTGKIIADLGLRGLSKGGASIAPWHGNIIINTGNAASSDILYLINETQKQVLQKTGFSLEPEIILAGQW